MTTYKKQLKDNNGNTIYPDVGIDLDNVVYSDNPEEVSPEPWVTSSMIDWSNMPFVSVANFNNTASSIGSSEVVYANTTVYGLTPNTWYLTIFTCQLFNCTSSSICLAGIPEAGISSGGIRFQSDQSSPCRVSFIRTGSNETARTLNLRCSATNPTTIVLESGSVYFIPINFHD